VVQHTTARPRRHLCGVKEWILCIYTSCTYIVPLPYDDDDDGLFALIYYQDLCLCIHRFMELYICLGAIIYSVYVY